MAFSFSGRRSAGGFTMVEIAIALGVIAFALIAIIGILPTGLQSGRDNREETLVNQDARLLIEAIRSGRRDVGTDIGAYVRAVDGVPTPTGIATSNLVQLLSDTNQHDIVLSSVSGAIANRGPGDFGFHYQVRKTVTRALDFVDTPVADQIYEIRLRFAWPVLPDLQLAVDKNVYAQANSYVARTLVSGVLDSNEWFFYPQQYVQPLNLASTNSTP